MTDEIANALASVRHLRHLHYAWDLMEHEGLVLNGIKTLLKAIRPYRHMCYMLVGFNTSFEEDVYRFRKLVEMKIDPYVMLFNQTMDTKLRHFARWVNARIYTQCSFEEYTPWIRAQEQQIYGQQVSLSLI
jgi:hypothetical protein